MATGAPRLLRELADPACLAAGLRKHILRRSLTFERESAPRSPKWLKRRYPRAYHALTLRGLSAWVQHLRADACLVSFPKSGRTWLRTMIDRAWELDGSGPPLRLQVIHEDDPFWKAPEALATTKTEYRHKRIVLLTRDAKDTLVSGYFQKHDRDRAYPGSLDDYVEVREGGVETIVAYGEIWRANADVPAGFLEVRYEEMHADPAAVLATVLEFLGTSVATSTIADAVAWASFAAMQRREVTTRADRTNPAALKAREGRIGGHQRHLTSAQIAALDERIAAVSRVPPQRGR